MSGSKPSYSYNGWQRLRTLCVAMRQTEEKVQKLKEDIETKLKFTQKIRDKRADVQASQVAIQSLEIQLEWRKGKVRTLSARLSKQRRNFGERDAKLQHFRQSIDENHDRVIEMQRNYIAKREKFVWTGAQLFMRRKQLVEEVIFIYLIEHFQESSSNKSCNCKDISKISSIHLPDAEDYAGHSEMDIAVGLGSVCHVLQILSRIFDIPLRYAVNYYGSRSTVSDPIDPNLRSNQSRFPLFKGQDKNAFNYGVFLLNKNIAQFRADCGITTQDLRRTLLNLRSLMEYLSGAKIEPFMIRTLRLNAPQSPVPSGNSIESSTVSIPESDLSLYHSHRTDSFPTSVVPKLELNSRTGSSPVVQKLHSSNGSDFKKVNSDFCLSNNSESEPLIAAASFTTDGWTADECIEHNRKILQTCYLNSDEFVDEDETHKNIIYVNGGEHFSSPSTIFS